MIVAYYIRHNKDVNFGCVLAEGFTFELPFEVGTVQIRSFPDLATAKHWLQVAWGEEPTNVVEGGLVGSHSGKK